MDLIFFDIQSQTEIAIKVGELFTSYGLEKSRYIAHRYMACIQIWEQMANNPELSGVPVIMFYDIVHKMALAGVNGQKIIKLFKEIPDKNLYNQELGNNSDFSNMSNISI